MLARSNDVSVSLSSSTHNLGFIFDSHLTFSNQVSAATRACFHHILDLRRIRPVLDFDTAFSVIFNDSLTHISVSPQIEYKDISTTYKLFQSSYSHYLRNIITNQPSRSTFSSMTVLHPPAQSRLKITNRSFPYAAPHLWNSLSPPSVFLINQLHHTTLHYHPLIQNWYFTCLMGSSILISKLASSPCLFLHSLQSLPCADSMEY